MRLYKFCIILTALIFILPLSCAKRQRPGEIHKPKKIKEDPVAATYAGIVQAELDRYQDKPKESYETVTRLIEDNPGVGFFYYERAVINSDVGNWQAVVNDCKEALRLNPNIINAKILLGRALGVLNRHKEAIKYLEDARREDPGRQDIYPILAKAYMNANKYSKAERVMLDLIARDSEAIIAYYYLGAIYGAYMKKPQKALNIYQRLLEREPDNVQIIEAISQLYLEMNRPKEALAMLVELERRRLSDVALKLKIAQIYYKMKNYPEAAKRFEDILARNPDSDKIMYYLGVLYEEMNKPADAISMYDRIPTKSSLYKDARLRLAYLYKQDNESGKAKAVLQEGINRKPKTIEFYQYLGGLYEREGDYANAIETLVRATKYFPEDENLFFALGTLYERTSQYKKAIGAMKRVLKINPNNASALNYIGYTYVELGENIDEAEEKLNQALRLRPGDGYILDSLAWLYFQEGDYDKAYMLLQQAIKAEPKEPTILKHMGQVYLQRGDKKKALEYFNKALKVWQQKDRIDRDEVEELLSLIAEAEK